MGVALQYGTVHERAGVTLVGVAYHIFLSAAVGFDGVPLKPGGESCAASSAETGDLDLFDDLVRGHGGHYLSCSLVAAGSDILFDLLRIDPAAVAENDPLLLG